MIGYIGVTILLCCFGYIFYIFKKPYSKIKQKRYLDVYKSGDSAKIPGMSTSRSKKRKR
jgi:Ca2+/Na+ antiporter